MGGVGRRKKKKLKGHVPSTALPRERTGTGNDEKSIEQEKERK